MAEETPAESPEDRPSIAPRVIRVMDERGLCYEDLEEGLTLVTASRTITEADVTLFAGLSGDFNPLHTDDVYAASTPFGKRIAHGALGVSVATGLANRMGVFEGTTVAIVGLDVRYKRPIYIDDTVTLRMTVAERKPTKPIDERGLVIFKTSLTNQKGKVVSDGSWTLMMKTRSTIASERRKAASP